MGPVKQQTSNPGHWSDCAVYNAPAYEPGLCDCGGLDLAAYERYVLVTSLIPSPGGMARFIEDGVLPSAVEPKKPPRRGVAALATTTDLPRPHDRVAIGGSSGGMDLNNAGITPVGDG